MDERSMQVTMNLAMAVGFIVMAVDYLGLRKDIEQGTSRLSHAMRNKYAAASFMFAVLTVLQVYSVVFALFRTVGPFTAEVVFGIRVLAVLAMIVLAYWTRQMRVEIRNADMEVDDGDELD